MKEIEQIKKEVQKSIIQKNKLRREIDHLYLEINRQLNSSLKLLKCSWNPLRKNLLVLLLRDEGFKKVKYSKYYIIPINEIYTFQFTTLFTKSMFIYQKNNSRRTINFTSSFFSCNEDGNIERYLDEYNTIYDCAKQQVLEYKNIKSNLSYTVEDYFKFLKKIKMLNSIDIETWKAICGDTNYSVEKFEKEIDEEKKKEIASSAIRVLRR